MLYSTRGSSASAEDVVKAGADADVVTTLSLLPDISEAGLPRASIFLLASDVSNELHDDKLALSVLQRFFATVTASTKL
jgi:hypothetical protein